MTSRSPSLSALVAVLVGALTPAAAGSDEPAVPSFARRLLDRTAELLAAASAARVPPRKPPKPIAVKWKARKLNTLPLGAPLLTMTAGDLDGDGRAELVAVTEEAIVLLAPRKREIVEVTRAALPGDLPPIEPRTAVATAVVVPTGTGVELWVRASTRDRGARFGYARGSLTELGSMAGYPLCSDREGVLADGRAFFERPAGDALPADWPGRYWAARCRADLVDREGRPLRIDAVLGSGGALSATVTVRCDSDEECTPERRFSLSKVGVAFALADVDRDGNPEVITSAANPPGDADTVRVFSLPTSGAKVGKPVFERDFSGGVAGLAAADLDGDGDTEVIAGVRLAGTRKADLWLLD
jgi:hypothetical protein